MDCTPSGVKIFVTLSTQWYLEYHRKALFETSYIIDGWQGGGVTSGGTFVMLPTSADIWVERRDVTQGSLYGKDRRGQNGAHQTCVRMLIGVEILVSAPQIVKQRPTVGARFIIRVLVASRVSDERQWPSCIYATPTHSHALGWGN
jgi:hypothetical protein